MGNMDKNTIDTREDREGGLYVADHPRFGPAGVPPKFRYINATLEDVLTLLREERLDAFEYEAIFWGGKPQIKKEDAEKFGAQAKKNDILLSLHGSYFINFCGEERIVEASKKRLLACATAAEWMNAYVVVFHPGFYGKKPQREAFRNCLKVLKEIVETMRNMGIRNVKIGPETMGKRSQFGSLKEVLDLCREVEQTQLVVDWSHLHARDGGRLRTLEDFRETVEEIERQLGTEATRDMHCHFTKIEFTDKGERRHHTLEEEKYGPDFTMLARIITEFKLRPVIISESPMLDLDAIRMRDTLLDLL